jgi:hypothetical protein
MQVSNKHGSGFHIENTVATGFDLLKSRSIDGKCRFGGTAGRSGRLGAAATLAVAVEGDTPIFSMDGSVMTEKEIAPHKGATALHALERPLFCICSC